MASVEDRGSTPKVRILVADDEEVITTTLASILDLAGYDTCAVFEGPAATRLLEVLKPDLIVTDITLPCVRETRATLKASTRLPRCRIQLFTGHVNLPDLLRSGLEKELSFDVIARPIQPDDLLRLLKFTLRDEHPALLVPLDVDEKNIH